MSYSRVDIIINMSKLHSLKKLLSVLGVSGMTVMQVIGCGVEKGTYEYEEEVKEEMSLLPKQLIMIVIENEKLDKLLEEVKKELYTGHIGDGKIFISPISNIIRVRTGEEGNEAMN